jgi:hypothetical protein
MPFSFLYNKCVVIPRDILLFGSTYLNWTHFMITFPFFFYLFTVILCVCVCVNDAILGYTKFKAKVKVEICSYNISYCSLESL